MLTTALDLAGVALIIVAVGLLAGLAPGLLVAGVSSLVLSWRLSR